MSKTNGPLYEAQFIIADDVLADANSWLEDVAKRAFAVTGIFDARAFESGSDDDGNAQRTIQFQVDDEKLRDISDGFIADIEAEAALKFGDKLVMRSRIWRADDEHELASNENPLCLNCSTRLRGQYCGQCGQRSRSRLISIWQLLREAFGDLLELDSRLWKTLRPLLVRPGRLTKDYLEGRRARYMPPFRTYLVLSVVFFVVAFFNPREDLRIFFADEPSSSSEPQQSDVVDEDDIDQSEAKQEQLDEALEALKELEEQGKIDSSVVASVTDADGGFNIDLNSDDEDDGKLFGDCSKAQISDEEDLPDWFKSRFTDADIKTICENNNRRGRDGLMDALIDSIPVALIILLPIMAIVMKLLYPLSRRYFVEHLLFFIHFHAFFFAILILLLLFEKITTGLAIAGTITTLVIVATSFYVPVYLYKAMRLVYGQGHWITVPKYLLLLIAYMIGAGTILLGTFLIIAVSA